MTDAIAHRGPDGDGQWCEGHIGLGHRRLAIIDLSADANQPMQSWDGRYLISYNGEVYNFRELRRELEKAGSRFRSHSDTEVVLEAVAQWGIDAAIRRFNGMFAFAVWDRRASRLLLGRDRYGIKPLYLWNAPNQIAFASEAKAFRSIPGFVAVPDAHGIAEYFTFQNILSERTFTRDVSVFPPGHWGEISSTDGVLRRHQYWDFDFEEPLTVSAEAEYAEELRRLLEQAVERQLVSDVEVGSYLSGGLDSGSIVAFAAKRLPRMKTFTVGFELDDVHANEQHFDERAAAERISAFVGSTQFETVIGARHVSECLENLAWHMEEPRVGQSYPNYHAAGLASRFVKVVLAGTGGDEILGGYPWRYPPEGRQGNDFEDWHFEKWNRVLSQDQVCALLKPAAAELTDFDARALHRQVLAGRGYAGRAELDESLSRALYFEAKTFLPGLLAVEDRLSMAHGLEVRVPFLDNDLVDFCQRLPRKVRMSSSEAWMNPAQYPGGTSEGKRLLRLAMTGRLPGAILGAHKQGFAGPDSRWFEDELKSEVENLVAASGGSILQTSVAAELLEQSRKSGIGVRQLSWSFVAAVWHLTQADTGARLEHVRSTK